MKTESAGFQRLAALAGLALLAGAFALRGTLESSMALHMLLQIPAILLAGALVAPCIPSGWPKRFAQIDEHGITGLLAFTLVTAYWMIPRALEYPLESGMAEAAKFLSLLLAGLALRLSLARANSILCVFFIGNLSSMTAIVGLLYQETPRRLCNLYLYDDQLVTGMGLVVLAVGVPVLWLLHYFLRPAQRPSEPLHEPAA